MNPTILGVIGPGFLNQAPTINLRKPVSPQLAFLRPVSPGELADVQSAAPPINMLVPSRLLLW